MTEQQLPGEIEVYDLGGRRLYAKTNGASFAIFEDELEPDELIAIAQDIANRRPAATSPSVAGPAERVAG